MDYVKIYDDLIDKAKKRICVDGEYYEHHHIIPKCIDGVDDGDNIVSLTAREHYIAHALLVKIYRHDKNKYMKLICAFRFMSVDSHNGNRIGNRDYGWMRELYSENHPMKNKSISDKVSKSLKLFYSKTTIEDRQRVERIEVECACGCGELFSKKITSNVRYIQDHYHPTQDIDNMDKHSTSIKTYLNNLSDSDMTDRMKKSVGSCDHQKRGDAISKSKRGVKTNQPLLERKRYGTMTQIEFDAYIDGRKPFIQQRMKNRRRDYLDGNY